LDETGSAAFASKFFKPSWKACCTERIGISEITLCTPSAVSANIVDDSNGLSFASIRGSLRPLQRVVELLKSDSPDTTVLRGRGELQFAVLAEQMRREGLEFSIGRPKVILKQIVTGPPSLYPQAGSFCSRPYSICRSGNRRDVHNQKLTRAR
jgi:hypothetical protein